MCKRVVRRERRTTRPHRAPAVCAAIAAALVVTGVGVGVGVAPLASPAAFARPARRRKRAALRRAKQHFLRGQKLFVKGRFQAALTEYKAAFDADPLPALLFNIGQCYRNLGRYHDAAAAYRRYLRLKPHAPNRDAVEKLLAEMKTEQASAGAGSHPSGQKTGPSHPAKASPPQPAKTGPSHPAKASPSHPAKTGPSHPASRRTSMSSSPPAPRRLPLVPPPGEHTPTTVRAGTPFYEKWWFWGGVAAVAAGSAAIYVETQQGGLPSSELGNWTFGK